MGPIITLTTDFGTVDGYVGAMKGVLLSVCPEARLIDITHHIAPQNIRQAAFCLYNSTRFFPAGTVHLVVIDPGVGSGRPAIAIRSGSSLYVGPDNGVFTLVTGQGDMAFALTNPRYHRAGDRVSHTFHGRDIFAPAAAHLAGGVPLDHLGDPHYDWVTLAFPSLTNKGIGRWSGEVLYLDAFGNAVTNLGIFNWMGEKLVMSPILGEKEEYVLQPPLIVEWQDQQYPFVRTYSDMPTGVPLALVGSTGLLEIAVRNKSAAEVLGIQVGDSVSLSVRSQWSRGDRE